MTAVSARQYDLIGYRIVSPFHLVALTAFAQSFLLERDTLNVLVILSEGPWGRTLLKNPSVSDPRLNVTFIDEQSAESKFPVWWPLILISRPLINSIAKLTGARQIPVCAPTLSCVKWSSRSLSSVWHLTPILIDEGIGTFNTRRQFRRRAQQQFKAKWIQPLAILGFRFIHSSLPLFGGKRASLFSFQGQRPILNTEMANALRSIFKRGYEARDELLNFDKPVVLILTQPFSEGGLCSENEWVDEIEKMIIKIRQMGFNPALKVHPAENFAKYDRLQVERVDYTGPVEEIFAAAGTDIMEIWGFTTTSLITGSALFGIRARRMNLPLSFRNAYVVEGEAQLLFSTYTETL